MMISRRLAQLCLAAAIAGMPSLAHAATAVISGTVSYRERIALPPGAKLHVKLLDISLADAPSRTLAAVTIRPRGVPIPYRLHVNRTAIQPGHTYALQARILVAGRLWFTTSTRHGVFGEAPDQTDIMVERVGSARLRGADTNSLDISSYKDYKLVHSPRLREPP